jgi:hypothetical protein
MDRSPFRTLMTKNFPSAPPSLQLLEDLFILCCTLKSWSSALRRLKLPWIFRAAVPRAGKCPAHDDLKR